MSYYHIDITYKVTIPGRIIGNLYSLVTFSTRMPFNDLAAFTKNYIVIYSFHNEKEDINLCIIISLIVLE